MSSYQPRYFVVAGGKLEYYKEESAKVSLKNAEGQSLGVTLQHSNIVTKVDAGLALQQKVTRHRRARRQAGSQTEKQPGRQAGRHDRQPGRQAASQTDRQDKQAGAGQPASQPDKQADK